MNEMQHNPVEIELSESGSGLYIFFGGIVAGIAMPPFEFYKSSKIIEENKIFIRDFGQCWYQDGLPGVSDDIDATAGFIRGKIDEIKPDRIFYVGNSMGGFAAILFANLIGSGEVVAFAPQTFISPLLRLKHNDHRWRRQIFNSWKRSLFKRKVWDLASLMRKTGANLKVSIFVSKDDRLDLIHAYHLQEIPGVRVHEFESGGHEVVRTLRDEGKLPAIMSGTYS